MGSNFGKADSVLYIKTRCAKSGEQHQDYRSTLRGQLEVRTFPAASMAISFSPRTLCMSGHTENQMDGWIEQGWDWQGSDMAKECEP